MASQLVYHNLNNLLKHIYFVLFPGAPDQGINMIIILQRRLINEIMTTYLPTTLILIIVYATNFFKPFFFEAVVTVNLTSLLVLTTLFISVSGRYVLIQPMMIMSITARLSLCYLFYRCTLGFKLVLT